MNQDEARRLAEEALERAGKATEGPWGHDDLDGPEEFFGNWIAVGPQGFYAFDATSYKPIGVYVYGSGEEPSSEDAEFISRAREDVPALAHALLECLDENGDLVHGWKNDVGVAHAKRRAAESRVEELEQALRCAYQSVEDAGWSPERDSLMREIERLAIPPKESRAEEE